MLWCLAMVLTAHTHVHTHTHTHTSNDKCHKQSKVYSPFRHSGGAVYVLPTIALWRPQTSLTLPHCIPLTDKWSRIDINHTSKWKTPLFQLLARSLVDHLRMFVPAFSLVPTNTRITYQDVIYKRHLASSNLSLIGIRYFSITNQSNCSSQNVTLPPHLSPYHYAINNS